MRRATCRGPAPRNWPGCHGKRRRLRGVCHTGMPLRIEEGRQRCQQHQHKQANSQQVACRRATAQRHRNRGQSRESRSLPEEMQQRPSQRVHHGRGKPIQQSRHRRLLSYSSSKRRSSSISSGEDLRPASACIMSWLAEPSKTRCSMSPASWRLVCSAGRHAS